MTTFNKHYNISILIPAKNEAENLNTLIPGLIKELNALSIIYEILIIIHKENIDTEKIINRDNVLIIKQDENGYANALIKGFSEAKGDYIITMDADLSHQPVFIRDLWINRNDADIIIASRYIEGGKAKMPLKRFYLSKVLNIFFKMGLSLPINDLSSGFRLYKSSLLKNKTFTAKNFDILQEILVKLYSEGNKIKEIPFFYAPRQHGSSNARVFIFGLAYLKTFAPLWVLRNSILSADYDERAYNSIIPFQRYWQRKRFKHVTDLILSNCPVLDVGCGSSNIISALPDKSIALDIMMNKLKYSKKFNKSLIQASGNSLPFKDSSFSCVLCSQVIEHLPSNSNILNELSRVLKQNGRLVIGTPDYSRWEWKLIEKIYGFLLPNAYADEHITHYTRKELIDYFTSNGYILEETRYIMRGELILAFKKNN